MRIGVGSLIAVAAVLAAATAAAKPRPSGGGGAEPVVAAPPTPRPPQRVRLALSPAAASFMTDLRVRSLLDVELEGALPLAEEPVGPLDEPAVHVYVDQPEGASIVIQVQAPGRPLTRRRVDVTGLTWDVAARFTAIATAEIVRAELQPVRTRKPKAHKPTAEELEAADRARPRVRVGGGVTSWLSGPGPSTVGPELSFGHVTTIVDVDVAGRASFADDGDARVGTLEAWLSLTHDMHVLPWLRLEIGGGIGAGTASLASGPDSSADGFGHAAGRIGVGLRVTHETWIGLRVEPGTILGGPTDPSTSSHPLDGGVVGLTLAIDHSVPVDLQPAARAR